MPGIGYLPCPAKRAARSGWRHNRPVKKYPKRRLLIEGFTDNVGTPERNMELSFQRANALRAALAEWGTGSDGNAYRATALAKPGLVGARRSSRHWFSCGSGGHCGSKAAAMMGISIACQW